MPPPHTLAAGRLGGGSVVFFALATATPLTVVATVVPAAYAGGDLLALPLLFLGLGLVLLTFAAGYVAMSRRMPHAGSLYCFIARGLGRPLGVGAGWLALLSYQALQLALYGLVGTAVAPLVDVPWWAAALGCWAVVAVSGLLRISVTAGLLALLVLAETVVIAGYSAADLIDPAGGRITWATLEPSSVPLPALGALLVVGAFAFLGIETTAAYAEEARGPRRAVARATCLGITLLAILYAAAAWAMSVATGPDRIVAEAGSRGGELMFDLAAARLAPWAVTLGRVLVVTGLLAAMIALHHTMARYLFALGRERVLPSALGRTSRRTSAPRTASLTQSVVAGLLIGAWALTRLDVDPRWLAVGGGLGILLLLPATSLAALLFLNRNPNGEGAWGRFVAPTGSTVVLSSLAWFTVDHFATLSGVPEKWVWVGPAVAGGAVVLGVVHGLALRRAVPVSYAGIGLGGAAVVVVPAPLPPSIVPRQRRPGAHRPERVTVRRRIPGSG